MNRRDKLASIFIINPFENSIENIRYEIEISSCKTIEDAVSKAFAGYDADVFSINGKIVDRKAAIPSGNFHKIVVWKLPEGGEVSLGALLVSAILIVGAAKAVSWGIKHFLGRDNLKNKTKYGKEQSDVSNTQYGWDYNAENAITEGAPIPILYGERYVIPPIVQRHNYSVDNKAIIENIYAIANGGGGFNDEISFNMDNDGYIQAQLAHASWKNYIPKKTSSSMESYSINRIDGYPVIVNYGMENEYETDKMTDGTFTNNAYNIELPDNIAVVIDNNNIVGPVIELYSESRGTIESGGRYWNRGVVGFSALGRMANGIWEEIGTTETSTYVSASSYIRTTLTADNGTMPYNMIIIKNFILEDPHDDYANYRSGHLVEVKIFGKMTNITDVDSDLISFSVTKGKLKDSLSGFVSPGTWGSLDVSKQIDSNDYVFRTTPNAYPSKIGIRLQFPYGLYKINETTGDFQNYSVNIIAKYKPHGDGSWTNFTGFSTNGKTITSNKQEEKNLYFEEDVSFIQAESYDILVKYAATYSNNSKNSCELIWEGIEEGWNTTLDYIRTSVACLKIRASKTLYGSVPQLRVLASRPFVNVYDTIADEWCYGEASNPAWAAYDLIVRPQFDDSYLHSTISDNALVRESYSHKNMLFSDFVRWARFCNKKGISLSMYFDGTTKVQDAIQKIAEIGRASIILRGNIFGVFIDCEADEVDENGYPINCFAFNDANIIADSWKMTYDDMSERTTRVSVTYYDKVRDYNRCIVIEEDENYSTPDGEHNTQDITLYPCDDIRVAKNHAKYILRGNKIRKMISWKGDIDSMALDIGDHVKVYDDYVTIMSISIDEDGYREYSGIEYLPERFPSSENVSGEVSDGLHYYQ